MNSPIKILKSYLAERPKAPVKAQVTVSYTKKIDGVVGESTDD